MHTQVGKYDVYLYNTTRRERKMREDEVPFEEHEYDAALRRGDEMSNE